MGGSASAEGVDVCCHHPPSYCSPCNRLEAAKGGGGGRRRNKAEAKLLGKGKLTASFKNKKSANVDSGWTDLKGGGEEGRRPSKPSWTTEHGPRDGSCTPVRRRIAQGRRGVLAKYARTLQTAAYGFRSCVLTLDHT